MRALAARARDAGFTLLETLVALAILGVVLTTVFDVFGQGLRAAHRDEDRLLLAMVAQNLMARSRLDYNPGGGTLSGDIEGGLRWEITSAPYEPPPNLLPERPEPTTTRQLDRRRDERGGFGSSGGSSGFGGDSGSGFGSGSSGSYGDRAGDGGFGESRSSLGDRSAGDRAESGFGQREGQGEGAEGRQAQPRERLRLRLVRVTVQKGQERFELTSLAMEPRRARPGSR